MHHCSTGFDNLRNIKYNLDDYTAYRGILLMRRVICLILACCMFAVFFPVFYSADVFADETQSTERMLRYIPWPFLAYAEPDFQAEVRGVFNPQTVNILRVTENDWGEISTHRGNLWIYLRENRRFINTRALYDRPGGRVVAAISPQVVTVLSQQDNWLEIGTWQGPRWINSARRVRRDDLPVEIIGRIALTFDDGPSTYTKLLLDALAARDVSATFFVLGHQVAANPQIAARIVDEGHEIANHSFRHPNFTGINASRIRDELSRTSDEIYTATGVRPTLMRPPYGAHNQTARDVAAEFGYPVIMWSVDTRDWESRNVDKIMTHFRNADGTSRIKDGDIILMHDIYGTTIDAAILAIDFLLSAGFEFVTVSELIETMTPGIVYTRAKAY